MRTTTSKNPILDYYTMAWAAGVLKRPIFHILEMPSRDGKSLTSFRFAQLENVLHLAGDTTAQGFRNKLNTLHKQQKDKDLVLVIVEDASKIRNKVREDFFALDTQFSTGAVNVDQNGMEFSFKTHASVIINTPPYFTKTVEYYLTSAGCGDRFNIVRCGLSDIEKEKLTRLGEYNQPNRVLSIEPPELKKVPYELYVESNRKYSSDRRKCRYACKCAGLDEDLVDSMHNGIIKYADWSGYWEDQVTPPMWKQGHIRLSEVEP